MPDRDGISGTFTDGRCHCHGCGSWLSSPREIKTHRAMCGRRWRRSLVRARDEALAERQMVLGVLDEDAS